MPWITSAGTRSRPSASVRSGLAMIAASCRDVPLGRKLRAIDFSASTRNWSASKVGPHTSRKVSMLSSIALSSVGGWRRTALRIRRILGRPTRGLPVVDMIDVSERTRSG